MYRDNSEFCRWMAAYSAVELCDRVSTRVHFFFRFFISHSLNNLHYYVLHCSHFDGISHWINCVNHEQMIEKKEVRCLCCVVDKFPKPLLCKKKMLYMRIHSLIQTNAQHFRLKGFHGIHNRMLWEWASLIK